MCEKFKDEAMGFFGTDVKNVVVTQNAGQQSASIELPIPVWEIIFIAIIVSIAVLICAKLCTFGVRKYFKVEMQRARTIEQLNV
jgi:hypothetical protein